MVGAARIKQGRNSSTASWSSTLRNVKNAISAGAKGYDAGKKVSGIKRHIAVDTQGFPHAIAVTTANVTDRKGALLALGRQAADLQTVGITADGLHRPAFSLAVSELLGAQVEIAKRSELHTFAVMPKRWIVERSFAWLEKCRRLWKNCGFQLQHQLAVRPF